MTNEEKIISILQEFRVLPKNYDDFELEYPISKMDWTMLMKLAEWKDQLFEQQREKLINDILGVIKKELGEHIGKGLGLYHGELLNLDASLVVIEEGIKKIKQQL